MAVYVDLVVLMNFAVDFLLLLGTNRLAGFPMGAGRAAAAAILGGIYGGACLLPGFQFLGNTLWRVVSLGLMGTVAFGWNRSALRRCVLFLLLSMALGGIALGLGTGSFLSVAGAAAAVAALCGVGFQGRAVPRRYIPVALPAADGILRFSALHDTGNTLRDPLTGEPVLVAGGEIPEKLTGMTRQELADPVACMGKRPGLRLIPFRSVGTEHGMLLAMRVADARIGNRKGSLLVAFAPAGLGNMGDFEALIGGEV